MSIRISQFQLYVCAVACMATFSHIWYNSSLHQHAWLEPHYTESLNDMFHQIVKTTMVTCSSTSKIEVILTTNLCLHIRSIVIKKTSSDWNVFSTENIFVAPHAIADGIQVAGRFIFGLHVACHPHGVETMIYELRCQNWIVTYHDVKIFWHIVRKHHR